MPGLLTAERRQKAKNRSRSSTGANKKTLEEKIKKSKPAKKASDKALSVDTALVRSNTNQSSGDSASFTSGDYNSSYNSIIATQPKQVTPTKESPRHRSKNRDHSYDESTAECTTPHSSYSSLGSPPKSKYAIPDYSSAYEEEMPDDEMMSTRKKRQSPSRGVSSTPPKPTIPLYQSVTPTKEVSDVLGLSTIMNMVTPSNWKSDASKDTLIAALNSGSNATRPSNLSADACILWDVLVNERNEQLSKRRALEEDLEKSSTIRADLEQKYNAMSIVQAKDSSESSRRGQLKQIESLKEELDAKDKLLKEQQESHQTELLSIQRVLADVTKEKMKLEGADVSDMERKEKTHVKEFIQMKENLDELMQEIESAKREADEKKEQIKTLELGLETAVEENKRLAAHCEEQTKEMATLQSKLETPKSSDAQEAELEQLEAEVSHQKLETEKLKVEKMETQVALASAVDEARRLKAEMEVFSREMKKLKEERNQAVAQAETLEEEAKLSLRTVETLKKEKEDASSRLEELEKSKERAMSEVDKAINEAKAIKAEHPMISPSNSTEAESVEDVKETKGEAKPGVTIEEFVQLQQTLTETTASLETSKKIIASLESANGSLAIDSRSKLKEKEEELASVQKESDDRKRNLDSLATELRDLQRKQGDIENADRRTKVQLIRQKALMDHLESTLNDLQEAVVVHESTNSNLEEISEILGDALNAITATLETSEQLVEEVDDNSSYGEYPEVGPDISHGLRNELDQKSIAVKRLEEALKKQNEDMKKMRSQFYQTDNNQMRTEIQRLRQQCTTNMEVLAKKERELSVLRSSLNVDENESGYISDDASDEEDDDTGTDVGSIMSATKLSAYGPADAEAYATILSQANGRIGMPAAAQVEEIESLKRDLMEALGEKESASKELQARRESLANAKMIISSLEQANKGMMADLRSRLQDSNTAISSLLNKSKQHENVADELRQQLQRLEKERLEERTRYEAELSKFRNEDEIALDEKKEDSS